MQLKKVLVLLFVFYIHSINGLYPEIPDKVDATVQCKTTKGEFTLHLFRSWSPNGYDRFLQLVDHEYFTDIGFFRVITNFIVQFGISTKSDQLQWADNLGTIPDDPSILPNNFCEGCISFAGGGKNSRGYQVFIATKESNWLGRDPWETPFGLVTDGLENIRNFYAGYGDHKPNGNAPDQGMIRDGGQDYLS
jgi:peptidyl-prolyl cis-trans isomerase A (cyclophilin A)